MVEEVSPIIYKKIDVSHFAKKGHENESTKQSLFYDMVSKKLIQISQTGIKIFNKSATNLIKDINLQLNKEKIYRIAVDKNIQYMLIFMTKNEERVILVINIQYETVIQILHGDLNNMLGMFFMFNTQSITFNENDDTYFTLVYRNRIHYFKIQKDPINLFYETIILLDEVKYSNNQSLIQKYIYNPRYMILCIQKEGNESYFDFYNLSSPRFYKEAFRFYLKNDKNDSNNQSVFTGFLSLFSGSKKEEESEPIINNLENYKTNHFFLENIYKKLYFIFLSYDEAYIQFYHIKSLTEIKKVYEIQFENDNVNTLQFVDNLILIHNFDKSQTTIIDLKSTNEDKVLYRIFPVSNYQIYKDNKKRRERILSVKIVEDQNNNSKKNNNEDIKYKIDIKYIYSEIESMLSYNNTNFYGRNFKFCGGIIEEKDEKNSTIALYNIYFDPKIYYEGSLSKYEAMVNLTRRKNGKDVILTGLYEMIKSQKNIKLIKDIFGCITKQIVKNKLASNITMNKIELTNERKEKTKEIMEKIEEIRTGNELPLPLHYMFLKNKNLIMQNDIYFNLFKLFEFKNNIKPEYIISLLIYFQQQLKLWKVKLNSGFHKILVLFLNKVQFLDNQNIFLQFHSFPDSIELANFLLYDVALNEKKFFNFYVKRHALQNGIDMLLRMQKYENIFELYVIQNKFTEALFFITRYNLKKEKINPDILKKFKELCSNNINNINDLIDEVISMKYELV